MVKDVKDVVEVVSNGFITMEKRLDRPLAAAPFASLPLFKQKKAHSNSNAVENLLSNRNSIFIKDPLPFFDHSLDNILNNVTCQATTAFDVQCKRTILSLSLQRDKDANGCTSSLFLLQNISGLKFSKNVKTVKNVKTILDPS